MKATTFAAAAVLLGSVSADGWESWSAPSETTPVDDKTTYTTPAETTPTWTKPTVATTTPADDEDTNTWSTWSETTSSTPVAETTDATGWEEWESTSSTPAVKTSTDPDHTWSEWSSTTSSTPAVKTSTDPAHTWSEWESTSSTPAVKTSTDPAHTWSEWESTTTPAAKTTTDPAHTWSAWEPTSTLTSTSTQWITVTVYDNGADLAQTWSQWTDGGVKTESNTVVVSSTITKTATAAKDTDVSDASAAESWSAWSAVATPVAAVQPGCQLEVSVSYGAPVWYPTPVIATSANSTAWEEWQAASTSADPDHTWSEWASSTSSTPAVQTSTETWSEWTSSTSSTPAVETDAHTWTEWVSSTQTQGGAFYTVPATSSNGGSWNNGGSNSNNGGNNGGNWSKGNGGISANGNKFGMTYSPYTANSGCKDQATVASDIAAIAAKGFTSVRVYSTDCSTLEFVGKAARDNGIKIILGVFISETGISGAQPQVDAITKWAQWDLVELIVVGNEAVFNNRCSASDLATFIGSAKAQFKGAGFTGAVSTTDELSIWQGQGAAWCDVVDVVTANLYAFFNPNTAAEDAGSFIQAQIKDLSAVCPGKEVYVMESGWPSAGECNGKACPSPENQATAIKGIQQSSGAKVVFFSFEDEQWKKPGQFGVEQHWGCGEVFN